MYRLVPLQEVGQKDLTMPCINADGTLSASGKAMLGALEQVRTPEQVAAATKLPFFRVRPS